jgi:tellurite resistance protein TerC
LKLCGFYFFIINHINIRTAKNGGDKMRARDAVFWVMFWICLAVLFNIGVYIFLGRANALQFLGGYVIEFSLSTDNLFLFLLIFEAYAIPPQFRRRVLNYGIIGAIILRFIFTMLGVTIVNKFHGVLYIFGAILLVSGFRMMFKEENSNKFKDSKILRILGKIMPVTNRLYGESFFIRINKVFYATPLFAIIVLIEGSDILFAIDSIPAIFSITTDPFIVYTSNIFAILGLRSLYFLLERIHSVFCYVKYGVALILAFTGVKLIILLFNIEISLPISLLVIFSILSLSIIISILFPQKRYNRVQHT